MKRIFPEYFRYYLVHQLLLVRFLFHFFMEHSGNILQVRPRRKSHQYDDRTFLWMTSVYLSAIHTSAIPGSAQKNISGIDYECQPLLADI